MRWIEGASAAGRRIRAEEEARETVETALRESRETLVALFAAAANGERGGLLWRVAPEPECPGAVTLGIKAPGALVPFCGSSAGLSQFESAAEISLGLHEAEIAEAKRIADAKAAEEAAAAEAEAQRDAEAIMPAATPEKPKRVPPAQPRQLPPKPTRLPNRNFYETLRAYFDEETGVKTLKQAFLEIVLGSAGHAPETNDADEETTGEDKLLLNVDQLRQLVQEAAPDAPGARCGTSK